MTAESEGLSQGLAHFHTGADELCLDFVNKISGKLDGASDDQAFYRDLVAWGEEMSILGAQTAAVLRRKAEEQPERTADVVRRASDLRTALQRIFADQTQDNAPSPGDLARLNAELGEAAAHLRLLPAETGYVWTWDQKTTALGQMLWPVVLSAANLLTSDTLDRVRVCANEACQWLFIDRSRNRSRKWCDMSDCGNVAKVRRYRRRKKAEQ